MKTAREELTHALYQNDAACRVINRLSAELQSARQVLSTLPHIRKASDVETPDEEISQDVEMCNLPGIDETVIQSFQEKANQLSTARKQRGKNVPEGLATGMMHISCFYIHSKANFSRDDKGLC